MRLINVTTNKLEEHIQPPSYAILSHTWRDDEVLFADFGSGHETTKRGYRKIEFLSDQARRDEIQYVWIDTVCIDKSSSAELSEAINSMFRWYQQATVCYAYLDDVDDVEGVPGSRWIGRAWTLQELIAPRIVSFFGRDWVALGTKTDLMATLVSCTGIDQIVLLNPEWVWNMSVASRMSYAAKRQATRVEDVAYCLFGIFKVNMPLLYGEGGKAFQRLQHEIVAQSQDLSVLAFDRHRSAGLGLLFAADPSYFNSMLRIVNDGDQSDCELTPGDRGLRVSLQLRRAHEEPPGYWANLGCRYEFDRDNLIGMRLLYLEGNKFGSYYSLMPWKLKLFSREGWADVQTQAVVLTGRLPYFNHFYANSFRHICSIKAESLLLHGFKIESVSPDNASRSWNSSTHVSEVLSESQNVIRRFKFSHARHDEAFIVGLKDEKRESGVRKKLFIQVIIKPRGAAIYGQWLEDLSGYAADQVLFSDRGSQRESLSQWTYVCKWAPGDRFSRSFNGIKLCSPSCIKEISLRVDISPDKPGYSLTLDHGAHDDQTDS